MKREYNSHYKLAEKHIHKDIHNKKSHATFLIFTLQGSSKPQQLETNVLIEPRLREPVKNNPCGEMAILYPVNLCKVEQMNRMEIN